jgi:hypothetical protein
MPDLYYSFKSLLFTPVTYTLVSPKDITSGKKTKELFKLCILFFYF